MPGFSVVNSPPRYQDTGQGAVGRIASWMAWTADPSPLIGPETTRIIRTDDNGVLTNDIPRPLGQGGCGLWQPILDGFSNGATSGGDNCFYNDDGDNAETLLYNNTGLLCTTDTTYPISEDGLSPGDIWSNGGVVSVVPGVTPNPSALAVYYGDITSLELVQLGGGDLPTISPSVGSLQLWNYFGSVYIA